MDIVSEMSSVLQLQFHAVPLWPFLLVGVFVVSATVLSILYRFLRNVFTRLWYFNDFRKLGAWAVVTGASDGIGQAYAEQLAKKGMNIMLISRSEDRVSAAARQISIDYPNVKVRHLAADFTKVDVYDRIETQLKDLEIGVLINNVGMVCDDIQFYWETSRQFVKDMVSVNVIATTMMTHIVMPQMAAKNRGLIVNVASIAGSLPPYIFVMYGATKKYMKHFTYGLQLECAKACPGVIVQDLSPWFVATKMARMQGQGNIFIPAPSDYVASSLRTIGIPFSHGHYMHEIQGFFSLCLPQYVFDRIIFVIMNGLRKLSIYNKQQAGEALSKRE